jgi:hypothetical protein
MMHLPSYSVAVWPVPAKLPTYMDAVTAEHPLRQFVGKDRYAEVAGCMPCTRQSLRTSKIYSPSHPPSGLFLMRPRVSGA